MEAESDLGRTKGERAPKAPTVARATVALQARRQYWNVEANMQKTAGKNIDIVTVDGFGEEWAAFDQSALSPAEHHDLFTRYFSIFPFDDLAPEAEGFDLGCGSGRWAALMAARVGHLHCVDPSAKALEVAKRRLADQPRASFHLADAGSIPLADESQDFGYSLGVLHHIPDTARAMRDCTRKLKPGAPFLVYLYYRFDNRPLWFRAIWKASDGVRKLISGLPFGARKFVTNIIAATVYWPLARIARLMDLPKGAPFPLVYYRDCSFYTMRTDALDRFGTRLEHRFTRAEIEKMMRDADLEQIEFRESEPYWTACGRKKPAA
jgi:SAM-dependent methyltransferase